MNSQTKGKSPGGLGQGKSKPKETTNKKPAPAPQLHKQKPSASLAKSSAVQSRQVTVGFGQENQKPRGLQFVESDTNSLSSSIKLVWEQVNLGPNLSYVLKIPVPNGQVVEASIKQGLYSKTIKGGNELEIGPVPVADLDVQGQLRVTNLTTGETVDLNWVWRPLNMINKFMSSTIIKNLMKPLQRETNTGTRSRNVSSKAEQSSQASAVAEKKRSKIQFFGIPAQGACFAFILDISISMKGQRLEYCKRELIQAIKSLHEHSSFGVFLYADSVYTPIEQSDWLRAKPSVIDNVVKWVATVGVKPYTRPGPAFSRALSYSTIPSVIYFLTDGELFDFTARDCAMLTGAKNTLAKTVSGWFVNRAPKPVPIVHTIALGNEADTRVLQEIADDHGGKCMAISSA